jgi:hypothetical protein
MVMAKISDRCTSSDIPLDEEDWKLLADLFEKLNLEDLQQIEVISTSLVAARLETWEESSWAIGTMTDMAKY